MSKSNSGALETDPRFPSGPWIGFFLQPLLPGRHLMELQITFRRGELSGDGRDWVGRFGLRGRYNVADGKCYWTKRYRGKHDVFYNGFNEGKGIWGTWEIPQDKKTGLCWRGGFHIWPEGLPDPTQQHLQEALDLPISVDEREPVLEPIGSGQHD